MHLVSSLSVMSTSFVLFTGADQAVISVLTKTEISIASKVTYTPYDYKQANGPRTYVPELDFIVLPWYLVSLGVDWKSGVDLSVLYLFSGHN